MLTRIKVSLSLFLTLALATTACAAASLEADGGSPEGSQARLRISSDQNKPKVGEVVIVKIEIRNTPLISGSDVRLVYDPQMLEVIDADESQAGVQFVPGDFIDPEKSFVVQSNVNTQAGVIDYALALVNPAPPVRGKGLLMQVTFRTRTAGRTTILISEGMFGAQSGETINPELDSVEIQISSEI
ncbi:MAG: hypothetical protein JXA13_13905 [Anaerolineales bacterium]|nr:hypothetical protein [Anaerolineales bacterium]